MSNIMALSRVFLITLLRSTNVNDTTCQQKKMFTVKTPLNYNVTRAQALKFKSNLPRPRFRHMLNSS